MFRSIGFGVLARLTSLGSNVIIIPLVISKLSSSDFSLWMLLVSLYSLVTIFDFGFSATISRYYSYAYSGVKYESFIRGEFSSAGDNATDKKLLANIDAVNNRIFTLLLILSIGVMTGIYLYYTGFIEIELTEAQNYSWLLFSIAIIFTLMSVRSNGILHGSGKVSKIYVNTIFSNIIFLFLSVSMIFFDLGIMALAISRLISAISLLTFNIIDQKEIAKDFYHCRTSKVCPIIIREITRNALKLGVGGLGNFLANRTTIYLLASYVVLNEIAGVSFVINISLIILSSCLIILNNNLPLIISFRAGEDYTALKNQCVKVLFYSISSYSLTFSLFVLLAPSFLKVLDSDIVLPSLGVILLCFTIFLIELIQAISVAYISTSNRLPFVKYQIFFGFTFVISCLLLNYFESANLETILVAQLFSQCIYNAWKWPLVAWSDIKTKGGLIEIRS
ncbi:hypothetical protein [Grimontia sp. SpTr1]|uniref:hypothetical protein n=1 Tax=Grimontia sp. SpTr1 TaxID=2995319 RepID=UPI00248CCB2F|nr:hypothetical protein [Grimontia sp. SpTr1]